jgi:hypothetical protein
MRTKNPLRCLLLPLLFAACGYSDIVLEPDEEQGAVVDAGSQSDQESDDSEGDGDSEATDDEDDRPNDASDAGGDASAMPGIAKDADCDFTGAWIARQVTLSRAIGAPQYASTWYYLEITQDDEALRVSKHFDCGIEVKGTVSVKLEPATLRSVIAHNSQVGRKGTLKKENGKCAFAMERFWSVRGADVERYLPVGADADLSVSQVAAKNPLPHEGNTDGAEDWENDGQPGAAWHITGIVSGTRNTVQRDWTKWFSDASHAITPSENWTSDLVVRLNFANEENVLNASNPTVSASGASDASAQHTLTLRFLGRTTADKRAKDIVRSDDFDTCLAIQKALPLASSL